MRLGASVCNGCESQRSSTSVAGSAGPSLRSATLYALDWAALAADETLPSEATISRRPLAV